jgi:penicillin-binding protein 2
MFSKKKTFNRMTAFTIIVILIFTTLILRLADLQLINGSNFRVSAESVGERSQTQIGARGDILDRNGEKLATNRMSYDITYSYSDK